MSTQDGLPQAYAESALKALSPSRSTYYTPLSVAVMCLCYVTNDMPTTAWWLYAPIPFLLAAALAYGAWSAEITLKGTKHEEEVRLARVIALSSSTITLVSAAQGLSESRTFTTIHIATCLLQIAAFLIEHGLNPTASEHKNRFNVIQLTLILSALLGGAAYCARKYVLLSQTNKLLEQGKAAHFLVVAIALYLLWIFTAKAWLTKRR
jgi:hypothetical protein